MKKIITVSLASFIILAACQQQTQSPRAIVRTQESAATQTQVAETQVTEESTETQATMEEVAEIPAGRIMKPAGDFHFDDALGDYVGTLYLTGYAEKNEMEEGFCSEDCKKITYAFFRYVPELDAENEDFQKYMDMNKGNSFVNENSFSIGCMKGDGTIERQNIGATKEGSGSPMGMVVSSLSIADSEKLLTATEEAPVMLKLTREATPGMGAPDCYSHFSGVELFTIALNI